MADIVPAPGTSLGVGLAKGLEAFVDRERRNKVLVLVSDGEDLEGEVDDAVAAAEEAGVIVHTVGVGTEAGQPVPEFDDEGRQAGYKRDEHRDARGDRSRNRWPDVPAHRGGHEPRGPRVHHRGHGAQGPGPRVVVPKT